MLTCFSISLSWDNLNLDYQQSQILFYVQITIAFHNLQV
ncbi:hypothetical protein VPH209E381_0024 [Vibrio phage 209E38-1]